MNYDRATSSNCTLTFLDKSYKVKFVEIAKGFMSIEAHIMFLQDKIPGAFLKGGNHVVMIKQNEGPEVAYWLNSIRKIREPFSCIEARCIEKE